MLTALIKYLKRQKIDIVLVIMTLCLSIFMYFYFEPKIESYVVANKFGIINNKSNIVNKTYYKVDKFIYKLNHYDSSDCVYAKLKLANGKSVIIDNTYYDYNVLYKSKVDFNTNKSYYKAIYYKYVINSIKYQKYLTYCVNNKVEPWSKSQIVDNAVDHKSGLTIIHYAPAKHATNN